MNSINTKITELDKAINDLSSLKAKLLAEQAKIEAAEAPSVDEPKKGDTGRTHNPNPFKRRRKRNQQDRFHSHIETHRHPSLNGD